MRTFIIVLSVALFLCLCYKVLPNLLWWYLFTDSFTQRHKCAVRCCTCVGKIEVSSFSHPDSSCLRTYCPQVELLIPLCTSCGDTTQNLSFRILDVYLCISLCWVPFVPSFLCFTKEIAEAGSYNSAGSLDGNSWPDLIQDKVRERKVWRQSSLSQSFLVQSHHFSSHPLQC